MSRQTPRIALVYSRKRPEEDLLLQAAEAAGVELVPVWDSELTLSVHDPPPVAVGDDAVDGALIRTLSLNRALAVAAALEAHGIPCVNGHDVIARCGDKWRTSLALAQAGVPTPPTMLATGGEAAAGAAETLGYPVVTKPLAGSWARMVARLNDADALEAVVEQREVLGHPGHHQHYLQAFVDKPGRDIRAFVVGDEPICAIYRTAPHWITNTARGAKATNCPLAGSPQADAIARVAAAAARAVGGGRGSVLAVDLMETGREDPSYAPDGLVVHEVNATMEFRNSIQPTGVDIPARVLEHVRDVLADGARREVVA